MVREADKGSRKRRQEAKSTQLEGIIGQSLVCTIVML